MLDTMNQRVADIPARAQEKAVSISDVAVGILLLLTMLLGGYFRFTGTNWDDYVHFHPDERFFTLMLAPQIGRNFLEFSDGNEAAQEAHCRAQYPNSNGVGGYFDARCSSMNPHNIGAGHYAYGTLPLFMTRWTADFLNQIDGTDYYNRYDMLPLVWRTLSALYDTITILIVFFLGVRLHSKWVGLLAAFLYACAVLPIQLAHFGTVEAMTVMWVTLTLYFAVSIQRRGSTLDYVGAGLAFGAALASRFNIAPLVLAIIVASGLRMMPIMDERLTWVERGRIFRREFGGLVLAGVLTFVIFRLFNPYAFLGPSIFGILPNPRWLEDVGQARYETSNMYDGPPHWQWVGRPSFLFAWWNMVAWGMGFALGLAGWIGFGWGVWRVIRRHASALITAPLLVWILVYFAFAGGNFVMSMRYYVTMYPALAALAAWLLVELAQRSFARPARPVRRLVAVGLIAFVALFTLVWAGMFTNIYRHQATFVQASHWVWEETPGDFAMRVQSSAAPLVEIPLNTGGESVEITAGSPLVATFTAPSAGILRTIQAPELSALRPGDVSMLFQLRVRQVNTAQILAESMLNSTFNLPSAYTFVLNRPVDITAGATYEIQLDVVSGEGFISAPRLTALVESGDPLLTESDFSDVPLVNIAYYNNGRASNDLYLNGVTTHFPQQPSTQSFTAPADGVIDRIYAPRIMNLNDSRTGTALRIAISRVGQMPLTQVIVVDNFVTDESNPLGKAYMIPLPEPVTVTMGEQFQFTTEVVYGDALQTVGATFAWEGSWDEGMPAKVCTLPVGVTLADDPPPGLLSPEDCNGRSPWDSLFGQYSLELYGDDNTQKREELIAKLERTDYIMIGTNRRYDSQSRIPGRWPMTNAYYDALFNGELGFELVTLFQETFELGPLRVSDQHLPIFNSPAWLNEFEPEEAFHVYDHPAVMVFKKSANFSADKLKTILYSVPLNPPSTYGDLFNSPVLIGPYYWSTGKAAQAPTQIQFSDEMRTIQYGGGTWSDRFDRDSLINSNQVLAVAGWYLALIVFGWAVFPLLFVAMPALADRGYGLSKFAGIFFVGWLAWLGGSARLATWSPEGVRAVTLGLALVSLLVAFRVRDRFVPYVRQRWRLLLTIELLTLGLFLLFVFVRLTNPDLWDVSYGGEKPMDFAYFNGVLRSTIFPPVDPWFANGYINYYYFGFVIVGAPTLFLGVVPSLAYNLIIPMLFAMTGMAAFSGAFSIVNALQERRSGLLVDEPRRLGNPYIAGIAAMMLCVLLGNLDTPRVFTSGLATLGGYQQSTGLQDFLFKEYEQTNGISPIGADYESLVLRAQRGDITDRVRYEITNTLDMISSTGRGFSRLLAGEPLPVAANRWFWMPTRVLMETPGVEGNAITELPYFTFLYADLHGHMMAMPLMLFIVAFVFNEVMLAGREQRRMSSKLLALFIGALAVGMTYAVNSWDYPTFMVLSLAGLGYAWWLSWRRVSRESLAAFAARIIGFVVLTTVVCLPYRTWFASGYNAIRPWEGGKSPLWAYFDIHGVFLFFIFSLLVWETARWMRATRVRDLRGTLLVLVVGLLGLVLVMLVGAAAAMANYQVALVVLPLVAWIALLFFRPGQSVPVQFVLVIAGLALCLTLGVEIVVLEGDIGRQNTVFKFYIQVWMLFSVAAGAAVAWLIQASDYWRGWLRVPWYMIAGTLVFIAALYPIMATRGKAVHRFSDQVPLTLNGADFIEYAPYWEEQPVDMKADAAAIRWLQDNVRGTPVIIEAQSDREYLWGGRVSIHTGLPSVIGWNWHQRQQRVLDPLPQLVWQRVANVNAFYTTPDINEAWRILDHFGVQYIVVAGLERALYPAESLAKFEDMVVRGWLEVAHSGEGVTIYRVIPGSNPGAYLSMTSGG